jgi:hypothetical protein
MHILIPLVIQRGFMLAASSVIYVNLWVSLIESTPSLELTEDEKIEKAAYTYIPFSVGLIAGSFITG